MSGCLLSDGFMPFLLPYLGLLYDYPTNQENAQRARVRAGARVFFSVPHTLRKGGL